MTNEENVIRSVFSSYINDLKVYSTKPNRPMFKMLEDVRDKAIKALETTCIEGYPTCTECEHYDSEKHYCPRFCQVIKDTLAEAQPTEMRDATEEERKSVKDYIKSISKPTGVQFDAQLTDLTAEEKEIIDAIHKMGLFRTNYANDKVSKAVSKIIKAYDAQPSEDDFVKHKKEVLERIAKREHEIDKYIKELEALEQQPCEDCISRKAVDKIINKWLSHPDYELKDNIYDMTKKIHKLPSVTPQRPKGKWIYEMKVMYNPYTYKCSVCKGWEKDKTKYCPNCGAEMSGGGEDGEKR